MKNLRLHAFRSVIESWDGGLFWRPRLYGPFHDADGGWLFFYWFCWGLHLEWGNS